MYGVQSDYKNIYKEKLVYDYKDLLAGMGLLVLQSLTFMRIYLIKPLKALKDFKEDY